MVPIEATFSKRIFTPIFTLQSKGNLRILFMFLGHWINLKSIFLLFFRLYWRRFWTNNIITWNTRRSLLRSIEPSLSRRKIYILWYFNFVICFFFWSFLLNLCGLLLMSLHHFFNNYVDLISSAVWFVKINIYDFALDNFLPLKICSGFVLQVFKN